jgi:hypothetical protein
MLLGWQWTPGQPVLQFAALVLRLQTQLVRVDVVIG